MKTKLKFLQWLMMLMLLMGATEAWAQQPYPDEGNESVCLNSTHNYGVIDTPTSSYVWSITPAIGGTITVTAHNTISVLWQATGIYTLEVTETNSSNCVGNTSIQVTVNELPVISLAGPSPVCLNSTGNVYTTQSGMTNYVWTVIGGTITSGGTATDNTATITWTSTGTQSVSVNYTNANGCTAAAPALYNVTVNDLPVPTITGNAAACLNSTGNVYTTQSGMTNYVWTVVGGTITSGGTATDNTATITWTSTGTQSVSVNYTNANGCTAAAPALYNVTVNDLPVPTITGNAAACLNSTGNVYTTQSGMTNYVWTVVGGTITSGGTATDNTATITWTSTGTQSVSVNYTNANGCTAAAPALYNVTVNDLPVPTITGPTKMCENTANNVYTTESGMTNYVWTVSAGGTITAGGGTNDSSVTVTWNTAGPQTVTVNYQNANGCSAETPASLNVTVDPLPVTSPIYHN